MEILPEVRKIKIGLSSALVFLCFFGFLGYLGFLSGFLVSNLKYQPVLEYALMLEEENGKIYKKLRDFKNKTD
tara:strand:+ start:1842 stop:2060 length:219 start_codon:yes stop_codon:yes gene_type:complete